MRLESSGKPDAWKLARPVWGWGRGATPRPTPHGSSPETDSPQPWVVHQYPAAGQYTITVSASSPDGTFSGDPFPGTTQSAGIGGSGDGLQVGMSDVSPVGRAEIFNGEMQ
ncbi:MAG: PKD domain-containing protein [Limisphaerales bacterium]